MDETEVSAGAGCVGGPRIETLLIELSTRFINLTADEVDREIVSAQRRVCEFLALDRSTLWQSAEDESAALRLTHAYQVPDAPPIPTQGDARALFPWALERMIRGETIIVARLDELPPEAARDKAAWQSLGTKSAVVFPLSVGGGIVGAVSFARIRAERDWPPPLVGRLALIAQVFGNSIARARNDRALREGEEHQRLSADAAGAGLWWMALDTRRTWASPKTRELFQFAPDQELHSESFFEVIHPDDRAAVRSAVEQAAETGTELRSEYRVVLPDGTVRWIASRGALRSGAGKTRRFMGVSLDITQRKQIEHALQQRNQYIETVLEQSPIGFAVHTIDDGVGRFVSTHFEEIYGVPRGTITSHTDFFEKVWPGDPVFRKQIRRRVQADLASGDARRMRWENVPITLASGEIRYITASNIPLPAQNLMVSTVQDVTDRVRAERALRESSLRFQQVAEVTADFIWEVDAEGLYTYTSPSVQHILGYPPEKLVGKLHFYDLFAPEERAAQRAAVFDLFAARHSFRRIAKVVVGKHGQAVHLETSGVPLVDDAGRLVGYRGADTDVTERKRAEAALQERLEEVKRLRDQLQQQNVYLRQEVKALHGHTRIVGHSPALQRVLVKAEQVAPTDSTVLLLGETGTGKELIAGAIHDLSPRHDRVMVRVNCAAIPASLLESELFGREKGAYTGALSRQVGRFELANGSTLFLDEIGDLPAEVQAKLLRVLQDGQFERLGSSKTFHADVRIIAATNRELEKTVREGRFREDLYYRLNVFPITVPPLRERREDIALLASAFVDEFSARFGKSIECIARDSLEMLHRYHWPGNVRELRNVIERAMIVATGPTLWIDAPSPAAAAPPHTLAIRNVEEQHVRNVLQMTGWRIRGQGGAAEILGLKPTTLETRMARLGIRRPSRAPTK